MVAKNLPTVPSGDPGALAKAANGAIQRINRPEITDPARVNPIVLLYCPDGALSLDEKGIAISYKLCKGCGICAKESEGIAMVPEYTGPKGVF
ncbi:2-oxoacid:ferredoxin oxidoreductase subunit alpha [Desulfitobacterium sp.]|uniref:2-oxoacid:ferredoxin oxidoreductase subunit alpha n=1 Tax=Desulfitobacterium sp. TaxID=49981 RepID=UPI002B67F749|nr:2-oxoacid:ferredoxin oxidoreductase subunit alpha [Desulfitobacterium sp.]HVJ48962.1 2-oxoacid:ferredoxin oxidoreductase subunit alpha [Desulfitobacterium sp.]